MGKSGANVSRMMANLNAGSQKWRFGAYALQIMGRSFRDGSTGGNWCAYPFVSHCAYMGFP